VSVGAGDVHRVLLERGETVAVAESLTGGLLGAALTSTPGASATFRGGLIVYATDVKESLAGVPGPLLAAEGPVSAHVAAALAAAARDRLAATYGVGVTGVAGPDPQNGQPVGTVHVAVAGPAEGEVRSLRCEGDREQIRAQSVSAALSLLADVMAARG
jgi:nicotinamide-nucleotide amidase